MPAFGTASIREMFPDMLDLASQLVLKWERYALDTAIPMTTYVCSSTDIPADLVPSIGSILQKILLV